MWSVAGGVCGCWSGGGRSGRALTRMSKGVSEGGRRDQIKSNAVWLEGRGERNNERSMDWAVLGRGGNMEAGDKGNGSRAGEDEVAASGGSGVGGDASGSTVGGGPPSRGMGAEVDPALVGEEVG